MKNSPFVESFATLSDKELQSMRSAIDTILHRREGGLPPHSSSLRYFFLAGEKACLIDGFHSYAVTEAGKVYSYKSSKYLLGNLNVDRGIMITLRSSDGKRNVLLHRLVAHYFLTKPEDCEFVHHKDGNKLNNHANNLHWVRLTQDQAKIGVRKNSKTGYRGVTRLQTGKFAAILRGIYLGCFSSAEDAAAEYNRHAIETGFGFRNTLPVPG